MWARGRVRAMCLGVPSVYTAPTDSVSCDHLPTWPLSNYTAKERESQQSHQIQQLTNLRENDGARRLRCHGDHAAGVAREPVLFLLGTTFARYSNVRANVFPNRASYRGTIGHGTLDRFLEALPRPTFEE